ncbi:MAG TPA: hypothetical protein PLB62_01415 [Candidatus Sumerlaeota bacterium]|nr:hypothetical protein [Candidatus Sumerlaeota bacterium]
MPRRYFIILVLIFLQTQFSIFPDDCCFEDFYGVHGPTSILYKVVLNYNLGAYELQTVGTIPPVDGVIHGLAFSPDGLILYACTDTGNIYSLDPDSGAIIKNIAFFTPPVPLESLEAKSNGNLLTLAWDNNNSLSQMYEVSPDGTSTVIGFPIGVRFGGASFSACQETVLYTIKGGIAPVQVFYISPDPDNFSYGQLDYVNLANPAACLATDNMGRLFMVDAIGYFWMFTPSQSGYPINAQPLGSLGVALTGLAKRPCRATTPTPTATPTFTATPTPTATATPSPTPTPPSTPTPTPTSTATPTQTPPPPEINLTFSVDAKIHVRALSADDHECVRIFDGLAFPELNGMSRLLPPGADLDALGYGDTQNVYLSLDRDVILNGTYCADEDVILWDGKKFSLAWDGSANGLPRRTNLNALDILSTSPLAFLFSLEEDAILTIGGGPILVADEDVVLFEEGAGFTDIIFSGSNSGIPSGADLNAFSTTADLFYVLALDRACRIDSLSFHHSDLLLWNVVMSAFEPAVWHDISDDADPCPAKVNAVDAGPMMPPPDIPRKHEVVDYLLGRPMGRAADFNKDGCIDIADLIMLIQNFL